MRQPQFKAKNLVSEIRLLDYGIKLLSKFPFIHIDKRDLKRKVKMIIAFYTHINYSFLNNKLEI